MTEPTPNLPLLRKILDHIDAHPEEHDQDWWENVGACGTTRCMAGWALYFDGQPVAKEDGRVSQQAGAALGLTVAEQFQLFYEDRDREEIRATAERIAARAGEVL